LRETKFTHRRKKFGVFEWVDAKANFVLNARQFLRRQLRTFVKLDGNVGISRFAAGDKTPVAVNDEICVRLIIAPDADILE
jgi:hypothetical protein